MPRIFAMGNPVQVQPVSKAVTPRFDVRAGGDNCLVEAVNGIGKTSSLVDPLMSLFDFKYGEGKDRGALADSLAATGLDCPYSWYADVLLDENPKAATVNDMCLVGYVFVASREDGTQRARIDGTRFAIPHSSKIYSEGGIADVMPYEALGIKFFDTLPDGGMEIRTLSDVERQLKALSQKTPDMVISRIKNRREAAWVRVLDRMLGFDAGRWWEFEKAIVGKEGVADVVKDGPDGERTFYDRFLYEAIRGACFGEDSVGPISDKLTSFVQDNANRAEYNERLRDAKSLSGSLDSLGESGRGMAAAEERLRDEKQRAGQLLGRIESAGCEAADERARLSGELSELEESLTLSRMKLKSLEVMRAEDEVREARFAEGDAESRAARDEAAAADAEYDLRLAEFSNALIELDGSRHNVTACERALRDLKEGGDNGRIADLAWTLAALHEERISAAKESLSTANDEFNRLSSAEHDASRVVEAAEGDVIESAADARRADVALAASYESVKLSLHAAAADRLCRDEDQTVDSDGIRKLMANAEAAYSREIDEVARLDDAILKASATLGELKERVTDATDCKRDAECEAKGSAAALAGLEDALSVTSAELGVSVDCLGGKQQIGEIIDSLDKQACAKRGDIECLGTRSETLGAMISSMRKGCYGVPDEAAVMMERSGIAFQWGGAMMRSLLECGREDQAIEVISRFPAMAVSVIVDDDDIEAMQRLAGSGHGEWFEGALPVIPSSAVHGLSPDKSLCLSSVGLEYLQNPEQMLEDTLLEQSRVNEELREKQEGLDRLTRSVTELQVISKTWYGGGLTSLADYSDAAHRCSDAAEVARRCLAELEDRKLNAEERAGRLAGERKDAQTRLQEVTGQRERIRAALSGMDALEKEKKEAFAARQRHYATKNTLEAARSRRNGVSDELRRARLRLDDARAHLDIVNREMSGIPSPREEKSVVEGSFDELRSEYVARCASQSRTAGAAKERLADAERRADNAGRRADMNRVRLENALSRREKAGCLKRTEPERYKETQPPEVVFALEARYREAEGGAAESKGLLAAAHETWERAERKHQELVRRYESRFGRPPLCCDELEGFDSSEPERIEEDVRQVSYKRDSLLRKCDSLGKAASILVGMDVEAIPSSDGEKIDAEEALEAAGQARDSFVKIQSGVKKARGAIERLRLNCLGMLATSRLADQFQARMDRIVQSAREGEVGRSVIDMCDRMTRELNMLQVNIEGKLSFSEIQLSSAIDLMSELLGDTLTVYREIQAASDGALRINATTRRNANRDEFDAAFSKWVTGRLDAIINLYSSKPDGMSEENIRFELRQRLLSPEALTNFYVMQTQGDSSLRVTFRNPRDYASGYVSWRDAMGSSGGEKTSVILTLLTAMLASCFRANGESRSGFMLLDNPFANMSSDDKVESWLNAAAACRMQIISTTQPRPPLSALSGFPSHVKLGRVARGDTFMLATKVVSSGGRLFADYAIERGDGIQQRIKI